MLALLGVFLGIVCLVGFGLADYFGALSSRMIGVFQSVAISRVFSLAMVLAVFLAFFRLPLLTLSDMVLVAITTLLLFLGYLAFYKGFKVGKVSIVSPIANSSVIVTLVLAIAFLNTPLTNLESIAAALIIIGTLLASFELKELKRLNFRAMIKGANYAFGAMLFWGIGSFLVIVLVNELGWFIPIFLVYVFYFAYSAIYAGALRVRFTKISPMALIVVALTGILAAVGFLAYGAGASLGYAPIVIVMLGAAPTLTVILALIRLKEKLKISLKTGIILILVGLVLLSV